jgi:hypothetical protein
MVMRQGAPDPSFRKEAFRAEQNLSLADRESSRKPNSYETEPPMKSHIVAVSTLLLASALAVPHTHAQTAGVENASLDSASAPLTAEHLASSAAFVTAPPRPIGMARTYHPFSSLGLATRVDFGGVGFDLATPLARKFNLRAGTDFFDYDTSFQEQGADVGINLQLRSSHAALDWFPVGGHLRVSPQVVFANNNRILATAIIPPGSSITLSGQDYISSYTDPLRGSGRIDFRKVSPGLSFGFGNLVPRDRGRLSIPVEMGFYYAGQPSLQVAFTGSACDPNVSPSVGCQSASQDPGFQQNLAAFKVRNDHNLAYARFFPIFSVGFGYRFW